MQTVKEISWDLNELHGDTDVASVQSILNDIDHEVDAFVKTYKDSVADLSSEDLYAAITFFEAIKSKIYQLSQFAHLNYAVNMQDSMILKLVAKLMNFHQANKLLFFFLGCAVSLPTLKRWLEKLN